MAGLSSSRCRAALFVAVCLALVMPFAARPQATGSADLVISQVYGGGGNSGAPFKNDFVEIFNRGTSAVSLSGMSIQYASATGTGSFGSNPVTPLSGTLQPNRYYLVQLAGGANGASLPTPDATGTVNMSGSGGKVALVASTSGLACNGGSVPCSAPQLALIKDLVGWDGANFYEGAAAPTTSNTSSVVRVGGGCTDTDNNAADFALASPPTPRNSAAAAHSCTVVPAPPSGVGAATPASLFPGDTALLTVRVTPGTLPASTALTVAADLSAIGLGPAVAFSDGGANGDEVAGDNTFTYRATVAAATTAGSKAMIATITDAQSRTAAATISLTVQAPPPTYAIHEIQGSGDQSPLRGTAVQTSGIVTGVRKNGFFIQTPTDQTDSDPETSEGLFVFTSSTPAVAVGDSVTVAGTVQEYDGQTEISSLVRLLVASSGNALPPTVTITGGDTDPSAVRLERYEGMRVDVDALIAVAPSDSSGVFVGVIPGVPRPFREPGLDPYAPAIPGMPAGTLKFDGNLERLRVDATAVKGAAVSVTTGAMVTNLHGPLEFSSGTYTIDADEMPTVTGSPVAVAVPEVPEGHFTVASFNMLDFKTDDVRMTKASLAIRDYMRLPDIIGVEEVDTQQTLDLLAARIEADAGSASAHYTATLVPGPVAGNQNVGFLWRSSVSVTSVTQYGADATFVDPRPPGNQAATLNDRPPLVLRATIAPKPGGEPYPITVVVNHLRSLINVDENNSTGTFARAKRKAQADYLAGLLQQFQAAGEHVVSVGDYNAYQFNDGYVDVIGTVIGAPAPATEVLLANADAVEPDFSDLIALATPAERYSYTQIGNAQVLDHVIVSPNILGRAVKLAYARINADFPPVYASNAERVERVSDHDPAVAYFAFPSADLSVTASGPPSTVRSGSSVKYTITVTNGAADPASNLVLNDTLPDGFTVLSVTAPAGWTCVTTSHVKCEAPSLAAGAQATFAIVAQVDCDLASGDVRNEVSIEAATYDPDASNNGRTVVTTVDNPPPAIAAVVATPATLWPVDHKMVPVTIDYTATDNCDPAPSCSLTVRSSEPADGRGDGRTPEDSVVMDSHHVLLRAERAGTNSGRSYTITISCTDATGNNSTRNVSVMVPKSQGAVAGKK